MEKPTMVVLRTLKEPKKLTLEIKFRTAIPGLSPWRVVHLSYSRRKIIDLASEMLEWAEKDIEKELGNVHLHRIKRVLRRLGIVN